MYVSLWQGEFALQHLSPLQSLRLLPMATRTAGLPLLPPKSPCSVPPLGSGSTLRWQAVPTTKEVAGAGWGQTWKCPSTASACQSLCQPASCCINVGGKATPCLTV